MKKALTVDDLQASSLNPTLVGSAAQERLCSKREVKRKTSPYCQTPKYYIKWIF